MPSKGHFVNLADGSRIEVAVSEEWSGIGPDGPAVFEELPLSEGLAQGAICNVKGACLMRKTNELRWMPRKHTSPELQQATQCDDCGKVRWEPIRWELDE